MEALRILSVWFSQASPKEGCLSSSPWKKGFSYLFSLEGNHPIAVSTVASFGTASLVRSHKDSEKKIKNLFKSGTFLENSKNNISAHVDDRVGGVVSVNDIVVWSIWVPSKQTSAIF